MVERLDGVYHARNARGRALGTFDDLDSARYEIGGRSLEAPVASYGLVTKLLWGVNAVAVVIALGLAVMLFR